MTDLWNTKRPAFGVVAVMVALALSACSGSGGDSPTSPNRGLTPADVEFHSLTLINDERTSNNRKALGLNDHLSDVAREHSEAMRDQGFFGHRNSAGQGLRGRLNSAGVQYTEASENLAQVNDGQQPAVIAHHFLMGSPDHRDNILSSRFREVGIGVAQDGDNFWITQVFIRP